MYANYAYLNTATMDQIMDDLVLLLTGTTVIANLSASCDDANTEILTTYSTAPYTLFDDVSATEQIIRVEMSDDSGRFKYIGVTHDTDQVAFSIMESWDAGTDTPTKEVVPDYATEAMSFQITSGGFLHVYASQFAIVIMHERTAGGIVGEAGGNPSYGSLGVFECSRDHPSLAVGDMPNWFIASTIQFSHTDTAPDARFFEGRDELDVVAGPPFTAQMTRQGRDVTYNGSNKYVAGIGGCTALTGLGAPTRFALQPIIVGGNATTTGPNARTFYGDVSARCDIWYLPEGTNEVLDIILIDNLPYKIFKGGHSAATTGLVVGVKFVVPYG